MIKKYPVLIVLFSKNSVTSGARSRRPRFYAEQPPTARAEQVEAKLAQQQAAWDVERARTKRELDECYKKIDFIQNEREALVIKNEELNADIRGEPFD